MEKKNGDVGSDYDRPLFIIRLVFFCLAALGVILYIILGNPMNDLGQNANYTLDTTKVNLNSRVSDSITSSSVVPARDLIDEGLSLILKNDCNTCHEDVSALGGPSYANIAARYKGDLDALNKIMGRIKMGGVGFWGAIPMPPYPDLENEDIEKMAKYILKLKGGKAPGNTP